MSFLTMQILGIKVIIWLFIIFALLVLGGVLLYANRKQLKEKWIKWKYPEKVVKVVIHYKGGLYKIFWRLIPEDLTFDLDKQTYYFSDKNLIKDNDTIAERIEGGAGYKIRIEGKSYRLEGLPIKRKDSVYPEIHYKSNNPSPIDFDNTNEKGLKFSAVEMKDFKDNDLWKKLLTLSDEKNMMLLLMILGVVNLLLSLFLVAKQMGWIK